MERMNHPIKQMAVIMVGQDAGSKGTSARGQRSERAGALGSPLCVSVATAQLQGSPTMGKDWPQALRHLPCLLGRALLPAAAALPSPCPREQSEGWAEVRRGPASGSQTEKFFRSVTKSLGGNHGPSHSSMLNAPNSSRPLHVPTPMPVLCPGMPFPPLSTWQTFILQTSSGGSPWRGSP